VRIALRVAWSGSTFHALAGGVGVIGDEEGVRSIVTGVRIVQNRPVKFFG
jgi:hypothetical protein